MNHGFHKTKLQYVSEPPTDAATPPAPAASTGSSTALRANKAAATSRCRPPDTEPNFVAVPPRALQQAPMLQ